MARLRSYNRAIRLLEEQVGSGPELVRGRVYRMRLRLWLRRGDPVRWPTPWGPIDTARLEDNGTTLISDLRFDRENLFPGLFRGIAGMRLGGRRQLQVAAHLAYGHRGVPGIIPADAALRVEVEVIEERVG